MAPILRRLARIAMAIVLPVALAGCGINAIPTKQEKAKAAWADVQADYQRRADLIPNLVETVKGFARQEREVLEAVTAARARATSIQVTPDLVNNPEAFKKFQEAQAQLSGALGRLLAVSEKYPDLKSNQNFLALQSQLEGTENRITVARNRYIQSVLDYNVEIRQFPANLTAMMFGYKVKPNFTVENEAQISKPPTVC